MTRELNDHRTNTANDKLVVAALDEPGHGGACHLYRVVGFDTGTNPSDPFVALYGQPADHATILFQNGPISVDGNGVNGLTHEVLLAILIDRLRGFQRGPYACEENANALLLLRGALDWLKRRTAKRVERGVEGTHTV